jgi:hypothetical protein
VTRLALLLLSAACSAAALAQGGKEEPIVTTSTVYFRAKGSTAPYSLFGHYSSEASAKKVFEHLARSGNEVKLEIVNKPLPKVPPRPSSGMIPWSETISLAKAHEVHAWMARQKEIAFKFPIDGCYARAHLMIEKMVKNEFKPRKIWAVANGEPLYARTKNHPRGHVTWGYHVAPVLRVRTGEGGQRWYVIDPSLLDRPGTVSEWEQAMTRAPNSPRPYLTVSKLGEGPMWLDKKRKPGSGYWPAPDPKDGPTTHALATMRKYKPWEGKDPPRGVALAPGRNGLGSPETASWGPTLPIGQAPDALFWPGLLAGGTP